MRLCDVCESRDNNFNLIRMCAASAVLVSHAFPIALGPGAVEPLEAATGRSLGWTAVAIFFTISGFLISQSFDRSSRLSNWFVGRGLRLFPGLVVVLLLTTFVLGPLTTVLPVSAFLADPATWTYLVRNLSLAFLQYDLPGVFQDNPYGPPINGSLWTLVHEVMCYGGVLVAGLIGAFKSRRIFLAVSTLYLVAYVASGVGALAPAVPYKLTLLRDLSFPFFLGVAVFVLRDWIVLSWRIWGVLAVAAYLAKAYGGVGEIYLAWIGYTTLMIAYRIRGIVLEYNKLGDYSYGVYIYAFPSQQLAVHLFGPMAPVENMLIAAPVTLFCAILSWRLVESPALAVRRQVSNRVAAAFAR